MGIPAGWVGVGSGGQELPGEGKYLLSGEPVQLISYTDIPQKTDRNAGFSPLRFSSFSLLPGAIKLVELVQYGLTKQRRSSSWATNICALRCWPGKDKGGIAAA